MEVPRRFHTTIWLEGERSSWVDHWTEDENRFVGKYYYHELLPIELWVYIFKIRAALQARIALTPAVFVLRQLRKCVESSWAQGSLAYARVCFDAAKNPAYYFGPYLSKVAPPKTLWEIPVDDEGMYIVELRVPDHPFYPRETDEPFYDCNEACTGTPLNPNPDCGICDQQVEWCIALSYGELLMWERPLWVMKKLGANGTWPGWEDSPSYIRTLAMVENLTEQWKLNERLGERRPDMIPPHNFPKSVLPAKWQPIIALSVILDIILQAPMEGRSGSFSSSHVAWESTPWATMGFDTTFYSTKMCGWTNPLEIRTLGFGCGASLQTTPFVNQYLQSGGTHCAASVRNHRVINQFGEMRNIFTNTVPPLEPAVKVVTSHTWYFAEDGYQSLPECPYHMNIPILNDKNNPLYSPEALAAGKLSGSKLFDLLAERAANRRDISIVCCPGVCKIEAVEAKTISWKRRMDEDDGPWRAWVPTGHLVVTKPICLTPGDFRTHKIFKSIQYPDGNNHRWSLTPSKPHHHCYARPIFEKQVGAVLQEDTEKIRNQVPAHWCLGWRASKRAKQILPVVGNPRIRYVEGQLPLAMALFSAMAWESSAYSEQIQDDIELFKGFVNHAVTFAWSTESSGPQQLVIDFGLVANSLTVLWDKLRPLALARVDVVQHVLVTGGYHKLTWSRHPDGKRSMPFILKSKKAVWEYQRKDTLEPPLKK